MNIQQARAAIKKAKAENSTELYLSSYRVNAGFDKEKLTSKDLIELLPEIKQLTGLTTLDLSGNQISDIAVLGQLSGLTKLNLSGNQISDIAVLGQLSGLTTLYLIGNQISDITVLAQLTGLTTLYLSVNQISDIAVLKELKKLRYVYLEGNPIENPPRAIIEQGIEAIRKYFEDEENQTTEYVYEAKVLIVGETDTGKTTLFKRLLDPAYLPQKGNEKDIESTVGINIKTWSFPYTNNPEKEIKAHLWDFGGQEIQYTLHQYFLTKSSFYIFLISNRVGDNEKIHKADYWFRVISSFGEDCPVLVVLNERNDRSANTFEITKYIEQFGANLGEIEKIDVDFAKSDYKWNHLLEAIKCKISNLSHIGEETAEDKAKKIGKGLPKKWVEVRQRLEESAQENKYIKLSDYEKMCKEAGTYQKPKKKDETTSQGVLLRFLHNLGTVINFEDAFLRNYLILDPKWLTKSLYMALEDKNIKDEQSGKFTSPQIQKLWEKKRYSTEDYQILLNLMLKDRFEIAYKVEGKQDDFVIPMLLPDIALKYDFEPGNAITLIIRFVFMPYGVFSRLIVQLNNYIEVQNVEGTEKQIVWKKGMLLKSENDAFAEVIESDDREQAQKEIKIRVAGTNVSENKRFLDQIVNRIYQINHDWFKDNLKFDEIIPCNCEVCREIKRDENKQFYTRKTLVSYLRENEEKIICAKSAEAGNLQKVEIRQLLDGVFVRKTNREDLFGLFGDTYNFNETTQFIKDASDNVSIRQRFDAKRAKRGDI